MAKIAIKYEKIIPFGGIFQFSSVLEPVIDEVLKWITHEILKSPEKLYLCTKVARKNVTLKQSRPKKCCFCFESRPKNCIFARKSPEKMSI